VSALILNKRILIKIYGVKLAMNQLRIDLRQTICLHDNFFRDELIWPSRYTHGRS